MAVFSRAIGQRQKNIFGGNPATFSFQLQVRDQEADQTECGPDQPLMILPRIEQHRATHPRCPMNFIIAADDHDAAVGIVFVGKIGPLPPPADPSAKRLGHKLALSESRNSVETSGVSNPWACSYQQLDLRTIFEQARIGPD